MPRPPSRPLRRKAAPIVYRPQVVVEALKEFKTEEAAQKWADDVVALLMAKGIICDAQTHIWT